MQGRSPKGVAVILGNCGIPGKEAELDKWYVEMHIPDVTKPGIFSIATRYENPAAKPEAPRYLAVYETDRDDPGAAWGENRKHTAPLREQGRIHAAMKASFVGIYKRHGKVGGKPGSRKTTGILLVLTDCKDPAREAEFDKWYDDVHLGDIIDTGLYFAATRYVNTNFTPGQPKYLAIYETDKPDPIAASNELFSKEVPKLAKAGHLSPVIKVGLTSPFKMTYSQADAKAAAKASAR